MRKTKPHEPAAQPDWRTERETFAQPVRGTGEQEVRPEHILEH